MPTKVEIGHGSQSYGYAESDGDTIYCSGPRRKVIKLLIEKIAPPDDDDADSFLEGLPSKLHGRIWARSVEHLSGKHDQSSHGNKYGKDEKGNRVLVRKGGSKKSSFDSSGFDSMDTEDKGEFLEKNGGEKWRESLTKDEVDGIKCYTSSGFIGMNRILRTDEKNDPKQAFYDKKIAGATSALMKSSAPCDMSVVRDVGEDQAKFFEGKEGETYTQKGFSSTTINSEGAGFGDYDGVRMHIKVPKGSKGAYVEKIGIEGEHEWLMPPRAKFRVDKFSHKGEGKEVHLTYLGVDK